MIASAPGAMLDLALTASPNLTPAGSNSSYHGGLTAEQLGHFDDDENETFQDNQSDMAKEEKTGRKSKQTMFHKHSSPPPYYQEINNRRSKTTPPPAYQSD